VPLSLDEEECITLLKLIRHFFKSIRGGVDNPTILTEIGFWVPERPRPTRSRPLFIPVKARTRALSDAPLTRAIPLLNRLSEEIDLFNVDYEEFVATIWMVAQEWKRTDEHESIC
jgi:hypothetical protein